MKIDTVGAPAWACSLVQSVMRDHGMRMACVHLWWRRSKIHTFSNGWSGFSTIDYEPIISVSAGSSEQDQRYVILHEIAHIFNDIEERHGIEFWRSMMTLLPKYGISQSYIIWRDARSPTCLRAAAELGYGRLIAHMKVLRNTVEYDDAIPADYLTQTAEYRFSGSQGVFLRGMAPDSQKMPLQRQHVDITEAPA